MVTNTVKNPARLSILLIIFLFVTACQKDVFDPNDPMVEEFVHLLVKGDFDTQQPIPNFSPEQIPALLRYGDDLRVISWFPVNPVSSFRVENFRLGECLLWTIESIRLTSGQALEINSPERYPSLNPMLVSQSVQRADPRVTEAEFQIAFKAYLDWWYDDANRSFEQKRTINPLENTRFSWR